MSAESEALAALTGDSAVTAAVTGRVFYQVVPEGSKLPLIFVERTSSEPLSTIHDSAPAATKVTLTVSSWARAADVALEIGDAAIAAMHVVAQPVNRFSHYDETVEVHASVTAFELWELGSTSGGP